MFNLNLDILYDNGKILCFAGRSGMSVSTYNMIQPFRPAEIYSLEDLQTKDASWFGQRQFIAITSDVSLKMSIVNFLTSQQAHFFTLVNKFHSISPTVKIGVGTYISGFNSIDVDNIEIGNHCIIGTHNTFGHNVSVEDYCQISHYNFINHCSLGKGSVVGTRSMIYSGTDKAINIPSFCNITSNSRILESLSQTGTYHSRKLMSELDSRTYRIL
jgi:carbonic anhydrase/acetyltransferase-like protein (isoleucine patch superfamily)